MQKKIGLVFLRKGDLCVACLFPAACIYLLVCRGV